MTKKNVTKTLEERMMEAYRLGHNYGVSIHPEIDGQQGEIRVPRELSGQFARACVLACLTVVSRRNLVLPLPPEQTTSAV